MRACRKCSGPVSRFSRVCTPCSRESYFKSRYFSGAQWCQNEVSKARVRGDLPSPSVSPCTDCGGAATEYDHRDYNHALTVEPVCRGCNVRRGKAIPRRWAAGEWAQYVARVERCNRGTRPTMLAIMDDLRPDIFGERPQ